MERRWANPQHVCEFAQRRRLSERLPQGAAPTLQGSGCGFARRDPKTDVLLRGTPRTAFPTGGCHIIKKSPRLPHSPRARTPKEAQSPKNRKNPVAYFGKQRYNTKRKRNQRQDMASGNPPCPCEKCPNHSTQQNQAPAPYPHYTRTSSRFQEARVHLAHLLVRNLVDLRRC